MRPSLEAAQRPKSRDGGHARHWDSGYIGSMRTLGIGAARLKREEAILWAILIAALGVRLAYLNQAVDTPLFDVLLIDSEFYDHRARAIVAGDWLGDQPFFMNPFYSYFLAAIYALLGTEYWWVGLVQAVLGTSSCYLIYALGRKLWSAQIGLLARWHGGDLPAVCVLRRALLTAAPITFLNLAALYWRGARARHGAVVVGCWLALGAFGDGAAYGLGCLSQQSRAGLSRSGTARLAAVGVGGRGLRPRGRRGGLAATFSSGGEWLLTTSSAGMNFYVGNHPEANGYLRASRFPAQCRAGLRARGVYPRGRGAHGRELDPGSKPRDSGSGRGRLALCRGKSPRVPRAARPQALHVLERGRGAKQPESILSAGFCALVALVHFGVGLVAPLAVVGWATSRPLISTRPVSGDLSGRVPAVLHGLEYRLPVVPVLPALRRLLDCQRRSLGDERGASPVAGVVPVGGLSRAAGQLS